MRLPAWTMLAVLALCGCGAQTTPEADAARPSTIALQPTFWDGAFAPVSANAEQAPGAMTLGFAGLGQPGAIHFDGGLALQTRPVRRPHPDQPYSSRRVDTWADLLALPAGSEVEVRQVLSEATPPGALGLCGEAPTTWVVIGLQPGPDAPGPLSIAAFRGVDVPGRETGGSEVCAVYKYARAR